jgi:predicted DsbA family dithiol-disulfide isomerase
MQIALVFLGLVLSADDLKLDVLDPLNSDQRAVFMKVANQALCPCNCPLTLAGCLKDKPKCKRASVIARYIARQTTGGLTAMDIITDLSEGFSGSMAEPAFKFSKAAPSATRGKPGAKLMVVEYADFRCPHCREAVKFVDAVVASLGDKIDFSFRHFPLQSLEPSVLAAEATEAAGAQGKFYEMHAILFKNADALKREDLIRYAGQLKLDVARFTKDLDERRFRAKVMADKEEGSKAGVDATPTIYINGRKFTLPHTVENFRDRAEYDLASDVECSQ